MNQNSARSILLIASTMLTVMLSGCATNPYHDYYRANQISENEKRYLQYLPEESSPLLTASSGNTTSELDEALSHGFVIIGTSTFNAPLVDIEKLAEQAKNVGATHVLYTAKQAGKVTGFAPQVMTESKAQVLSEETTLHAQNHISSESMEAKSSDVEDKDKPFWGIGYLPVSYNKQRFNQSATFLVRNTKVPELGLETQSLNADQKRRLGYNRGVVVKRVFYDSPGFAANLKKGDLLYSVNGIVIENQRHFHTIAKSYAGAGRLMVFEVLRGTEPLQVTLNPAAKGPKTLPLLVEQAEPSGSPINLDNSHQADSEDLQKAEALKTPEEKQEEAAQRWAVRKKAYDARIQKKQARAKDGFFMGLYHSMTDWFASDE